jgi:hypothetical protein
MHGRFLNSFRFHGSVMDGLMTHYLLGHFPGAGFLLAGLIPVVPASSVPVNSSSFQPSQGQKHLPSHYNMLGLKVALSFYQVQQLHFYLCFFWNR